MALAERKGAAFLPIPAQGRIGPFEQIVVEVNAFMDMWGEYNDFLLCKVMNDLYCFHLLVLLNIFEIIDLKYFVKFICQSRQCSINLVSYL